MTTIKKYSKIFKMLFKANLMSELQYKANFVTAFILINLWLIINIIFIKSIYSYFPSIGNWTEDQALFFIATFNVVDSLFFLMFFRGILGIQNDVKSGQYDFVIVKPIDGIFLTCFKKFDITRIVNLIFALLLFVYTLQKLDYTAFALANFIILMLAGVIIYASIFLMINALSFYIVNVFTAIQIFFDLMEFARLPSSLTTGILRKILMTIFPILLISGVPCEFLFGYVGTNVMIFSIAITLLTAFISIKFYKFSVRRYSGASS